MKRLTNRIAWLGIGVCLGSVSLTASSLWAMAIWTTVLYSAAFLVLVTEEEK